MNPFVRRSHLLVPVTRWDDVQASWRHNADAVILDLTGANTLQEKAQARVAVKDAIPLASKGGAEVFVRINKPMIYADIEASAWPGLTGIVLPNAEAASDVANASAVLEEMEKRRGIPGGSLQIIVLLDTGKGIWNVREIISASPRVCSVGLDEASLCANLGIVPVHDFDPFVYAKGRIVIEGTSAKVQPIGIAHPYGVLPRFDNTEEIYAHTRDGKNLGFKGTICPHASWVEPCNRAFTPTEEWVVYHRQVRKAFAEGIARGTAAVPLDGRMIDVPVDERARVTIELYERCVARDAEKAAALARTSVW